MIMKKIYSTPVTMVAVINTESLMQGVSGNVNGDSMTYGGVDHGNHEIQVRPRHNVWEDTEEDEEEF